MLFISQCFISWTKALPGQFICPQMPLKFRKIGCNLYFHTFNSFSSNATSLGYIIIASILQKLFCGIEALISYFWYQLHFLLFHLQRHKARRVKKITSWSCFVFIRQRKRYVRCLELRALFCFLLFSLSFSREQKRIETCV